MATDPVTMQTENSRRRLLARLRVVRRIGVAVAASVGLAQTVLAGLAGALLAIEVDYVYRLSGPARLVLGAGLILLVTGAACRFLLRRLRLPALPDMARQVQDELEGATDNLASGTEFALAGADGPLVERTIAAAAGLAEQLAVTRLVRWRWLAAWGLAAALAGAVLVCIWRPAGWWFERGLQRLAWPLVQVEWPRRVQIVSTYGAKELLAPQGEPLALAARLVRGPASTPMVLALEESGRIRRFEMMDGGEGARTVTIRPGNSGRFWFEAGDDSTAGTPGRIRVVPRPQVTRAEILVQPPAYTGQSVARFALGSSPVRVPEGSRIDLVLTVSKVVAGSERQVASRGSSPDANDLDGSPSEAGGQVPGGRPQTTRAWHPKATITLAPADGSEQQPGESLVVQSGSDHRQLVTSWQCRGDSLVRAEFTDTDGLSNALLQPWRIVVQKDHLPHIEVQGPADNIEVAPTATLAVQAQVSDDWGIGQVDLAWNVVASGTAVRPDEVIHVPTSQPERMADVVRAAVDQSWPLEPLSLQPGDRIAWHLSAHDNFDLDGRTHEPVRSAERTIRIISQIELLKAVLDQLALARQQVAQLQGRQDELAQAIKTSDAASSSALRRQAGQQGRIVQQTRDATRDLSAAAQRLQTNRVDRPDMEAAVRAAADQLNRVQAREMALTQESLQNAQARSMADPARSADMADAARLAREADKSLQDILERTGAWTTVESAAIRLEDLIARHQALGQQTQKTGQETLGKAIDDLSGAQRKNLQDLSQAQRSLSEQLRRLEKDMAGPYASGPLAQAAQRLKEANAVAEMASGADELARNITTSARQHQQEAQQAMEQALGVLRGRAQRAPPPGEAESQAQATTTLAQRLQEFAQRQINLKDQTGQLHARRDNAGRLDRPNLLRLGVAGKDQADLANQVGKVHDTVLESETKQSLQSVADQMSRIAGQMQAGASDGHVQDAQQQAANRLLAMAEVVRKQARSEESSAEESSGQGVSSKAGKPGAVDGSKGGQTSRSGQSAEDQPQAQQAGAGGRGRQGGGEAARDSFVPPEQQAGPAAALPSQMGQVDAWGFLPPDQRRQVLQGMQAQPPPQYRKFTERYWRMLNEAVAGEDDKVTK